MCTDLNVTVLPLQNNIRANIKHPVVQRMDKFINALVDAESTDIEAYDYVQRALLFFLKFYVGNGTKKSAMLRNFTFYFIKLPWPPSLSRCSSLTLLSLSF